MACKHYCSFDKIHIDIIIQIMIFKNKMQIDHPIFEILLCCIVDFYLHVLSVPSKQQTDSNTEIKGNKTPETTCILCRGAVIHNTNVLMHVPFE